MRGSRRKKSVNTIDTLIMTGPDEQNEESQPSRSAKKRESTALQKLGEELADLSREERAGLDLPEDLAEALALHDKLKDREGRRRQRQYIGRIMRGIDCSEIEKALARKKNMRASHIAHFHRAENWRNKLLSAQENQIDSLMAELFASADKEVQDQKTDFEELVKLARMAGNMQNNYKRRLFREIAALFPEKN